MFYLYVKTHNTTGLKYLGQTSSSDPYRYKGSGKRWVNHLRKHGADFTTHILLQTDDLSELRETGLFFSRLFSIVESDEWANLKLEEGDGGWPPSALLTAKKPEARERAVQTRKSRYSNEQISCKISEGLRKNERVKSGLFKGKTHTQETIERMKKPRPHFSGAKNHRSGTFWIKNIETRHSMQIRSDEEIPDGYVRGRIINKNS